MKWQKLLFEPRSPLAPANPRSPLKVAAVAGLLLLALFGTSLPAQAADKVFTVPLGGVRELNTGVRLIRISAGDNEVIDIDPVGNTNVLIKGKRIGNTNLMVWGRGGEQITFSVQVGLDLDSLAFSLLELFPEEKISLQGTGETLVLRGSASSLEAMHAIDQWVEGYVHSLGSAGSRLRVINLVELPAQQQVQLEVRFAEVSRTAIRKMGINLLANQGGNTVGLTGAFSAPPTLGEGGRMPSNMPAPLSESIRVVFNSDPGANLPFNLVLSILNGRGLSRTLSEPTLVALSGQKAEFLVGGELPVPIPMGLSQVSIEYKKFGVQLEFTPTVLRDRTIQLDLASTVSDLDYSRSIKLEGYEIPALSTRQSKTTIRLKSEQSFAIAGLLSDKMNGTVEKVPLLGDIPILGALFRSKQFQREETELVVVVSAHLVEPYDARQMPLLPGEGVLMEPTDLELFLLGWIDVERPDPQHQQAAGSRPGPGTGTAPAGRPVGRTGFR